MQEELITFETAKLAKEKGFNEITYLFFNSLYPKGEFNLNKLTNYDKITGKRNDFTSLSTQSLLQKWLREKHNILVEPSWEGTHEIYSINYRIIILGNTIYKDFRGCFDGQSYEQALEVGLQEALKLIKI